MGKSGCVDIQAEIELFKMTLTEITEYREEILDTLFDIQISVNNAKVIGTASEPDEQWVTKHGFFRHYMSQAKFICIIQLAKLLCDNGNQKFNFHKFLRRLESGKPPEIDENGRNKVRTPADLKAFADSVRNVIGEYQDEIEVLEFLRNKVYAHKDNPIHGKSLVWPKVEELSELCVKVYNMILGDFFDAEFSFQNKNTWGPKWVIERAAETKHTLPKSKRC